jgi:hypothetical protein
MTLRPAARHAAADAVEQAAGDAEREEEEQDPLGVTGLQAGVER